MNESVLDRRFDLDRGPGRVTRLFQKRRSSGFYGYVFLGIAIVIGYLLRDLNLITAESGIGYWLGITGASLMAFLLLYPLRKRFRILYMFGSTERWFQLHIVLGLLGPLLVLYHCNFRLGSFNSRVALYCMLLVAISGIVGRHLYSKIHSGLHGKKTTLCELQSALMKTGDNTRGMPVLFPQLTARLDKISTSLQGNEITQSISMLQAVRWGFTRPFLRLSLILTVHRELKALAAENEVIRQNQEKIQKMANRYIRNCTSLMTHVAQFSCYERLFSLWHLFHLPFFFMLVISALVHVLAVHMY